MVKNSYIKWAFIAFLVYSLLNILGSFINFGATKLFADPDLIQILANILTSTQGFFAGIIGYGDYFEYSRFHLIPFLLGGLVWVLVALFLYYQYGLIKKGDTINEKLSFLSKKLLKYGIIVLILSFFATLIRYIFLNNPLSYLLLIFMAVIYMPLILLGILFGVISTIFIKK